MMEAERMLGLSEHYSDTTDLRGLDPFQNRGRIHSIQGRDHRFPPGCNRRALPDMREGRKEPALAEVIGFSGEFAQIMPFGPSENLQRGDCRRLDLSRQMRVPVGK